MSPCSRCMPLGGLRRALRGWWRYWAPMLSFFTGPERLGVALSELVLLGFCFTACTKKNNKYYTSVPFRTATQQCLITCTSNKWQTIVISLGWFHTHTLHMVLTSFLASISKSLSLPGSPSSISSLLWREKGKRLMVTLCPLPFLENGNLKWQEVSYIHKTLFPRITWLLSHLSKEFSKCQTSKELFWFRYSFFPLSVRWLRCSFPLRSLKINGMAYLSSFSLLLTSLLACRSMTEVLVLVFFQL